MPNIPQMLGQVTRGSSLQPSRANAPAGLPTVAIEQPNLHNVDPLLWESSYDSFLQSAKATKTKNDDKTSVSSAGISWNNFMDFTDVIVDDMNLNWDQIIPADKIAEMKAEEQQKKEEAYLEKVMAEGAPRKPTMKRRNRERERDSRPNKFHKEEQERNIYRNDFLRALSLQGGPGDPPSEAFRLFPPQYNTDGPLGRLWSTHYTISQDHTSGQEAHEDSLLASFGKRRRTDEPSIPLGGSRLLQRSPTLLTSLADGNDVVAQNEGSYMYEVTEEDFDYFDNIDTIDLDAPKDAVSLPKDTATTKPNEGKDRTRGRTEGMKSSFNGSARNDATFRYAYAHWKLDTTASSTSLSTHPGSIRVAINPPETLKRRCHSCNRGVSGGEWRRGPDGVGTLCNACGLHYARLERKRG